VLSHILLQDPDMNVSDGPTPLPKGPQGAQSRGEAMLPLHTHTRTRTHAHAHEHTRTHARAHTHTLTRSKGTGRAGTELDLKHREVT
jgi:hypothetical protein